MKSLIFLIVITLAAVHLAYCCKCAKPQLGDEVCGSDGKTYNSSCHLFCDGFMAYQNDPRSACLTEVHKGACDDEPCTCEDACHDVCGSDGKTYGNDCTLECAKEKNPNLYKASEGKCSQQAS